MSITSKVTFDFCGRLGGVKKSVSGEGDMEEEWRNEGKEVEEGEEEEGEKEEEEEEEEYEEEEKEEEVESCRSAVHVVPYS